MTVPKFETGILAALISPPLPDYLESLDRVRAAVATADLASGGEAVRHFGRFLERVRDLDAEELAELYSVSFTPANAESLQRAAGDLRRSGCGACPRVLPVLEELLTPLEIDRNPFAGLFKALCCLLLTCRTSSTLASRHGSAPASSSSLE